MQKMKVLAIAPNPEDATCWWRCVSPFSVLREQSDGTFEFTLLKDTTHDQISGYDLLFMQRPCRPQDVVYMQFAQRMGIPVVVDYDDEYTDIPVNNPRMLEFMNEPVQNAIKKLLRGADLVITSTVELKKVYQQYNRRVAVVPNGFDDRLQLSRGDERLPYRRVLWRGGDAHNEDMTVYAKQIIRVANEGPEAIYSFLGHSFYEMHDAMPHLSMEEFPFRDVLSYFNLLGELRPAIVIVPLNDTHFNRCKSNISIMEAAWAGAAVLAPDWPDWRAAGVTNYSGPKDFGDKLLALLQQTDATLKKKAQETWDAVRQNLLVSRANKLRALFFLKLIEEFREKRTKTLVVQPDNLDQITAALAVHTNAEEVTK